ncbi:hypothetical protein PM082_014708 [Marasmius tenuissimus]|nr:hypothetical protein PM082_014708 [Marasmius tenuissimus]
MPRIYYTIVLTFFVASTVASPYKVARDVCDLQQIGADVQNIHDLTVTLDNKVLALPASGATASDVQGIQTGIANIASSIDTAAGDINPCGTFADDVFQGIINEVQGIVDIETKAMNDLASARAAFDASSAAAIRGNLQDLRSSSVNLESVWLSRAPADHVNEANDLSNAINAVLDRVLNAFA